MKATRTLASPPICTIPDRSPDRCIQLTSTEISLLGGCLSSANHWGVIVVLDFNDPSPLAVVRCGESILEAYTGCQLHGRGAVSGKVPRQNPGSCQEMAKTQGLIHFYMSWLRCFDFWGEFPAYIKAVSLSRFRCSPPQ